MYELARDEAYGAIRARESKLKSEIMGAYEWGNLSNKNVLMQLGSTQNRVTCDDSYVRYRTSAVAGGVLGVATGLLLNGERLKLSTKDGDGRQERMLR